MGLRARIKRWLARHTLVIEFCDDCGTRQRLVWTASDQLWSQVSGHGNGGGVLCPNCFDRRADQMGYLLRWVPQVESVTLTSENWPQTTLTLTGLAEGRGIEPRRE